MELNITLAHFAAFALMAYMASFFATGARLARLVGWIFLWQLMTPVQPILIDVPMMLAGWGISELLYFLAMRLMRFAGV